MTAIIITLIICGTVIAIMAIGNRNKKKIMKKLFEYIDEDEI